MHVQNLKPLTSLRFFAALWVLIFSYWPNLAGAGAMPGLVAKGYLGVEVFFILSGFILCHVYLPALEAGSYRYGSFVWARLARVYPLHLATLMAVGVMGAGAALTGRPIEHNVMSWPALLPNLTMTHAWGLTNVAGWNHSSWSISAEWFAYLSFPAFAWAALKLKARPLAALAGALAVMIVIYPAFQALAGFPLTQATIAWGALRIVPCFAYGCALYLVWRSGALNGRAISLAGAFFSGAALLLGAQSGLPDMGIAMAGGALIFFLAVLSNQSKGWLSAPAFVYLGEISYAIYMIHVPWALLFINGVAAVGGATGEVLPLWLWIVFTVAVIPLSAAAHHLIERPARDGLKRLAARWGGRGGQDTVNKKTLYSSLGEISLFRAAFGKGAPRA